MKRIAMMLGVLGAAGLASATVQADPASDLKAFQGYFAKKYPKVKKDEFANGLYGLPEFKEYRDNWEALNDFPGYELGMSRGKAVWDKPFANGGSFAKCVKAGSIKPANTYPRWDSGKKSLRVAEMDIIDCAKSNKSDLPFAKDGLDFSKEQKTRVQLAEVTAYFYSQYRGKRVAPDANFKDPAVLAAYEDGKKFWWTRRGQLNFACSHCHMDIAGKDMGNQPMSVGLGHPVGWPAQRLAWGRLETIMQRYATCNSQVRAKPFKHYGKEYLSLQLYETYMSSGLPLTAPSIRN